MIEQDRKEGVARAIIHVKNLLLFILVAILIVPLTFLFGDQIINSAKREYYTKFHPVATHEFEDTTVYWSAPDLKGISDEKHKAQILYGKDLIVHTAKYLGPKGSVMQITNGMNCQNCHLEGGTKIFGNNYSAVAATYPKFRPRSGTIEDVYKRVNDCMERSLNGMALDTLGAEMQAIKAYILFLGSEVEKGVKPEGSGLKDLAWLDRPADPDKGKNVYDFKCTSCHMPDGQGQKMAGGIEYLYPPLWGDDSFNDGAGLYRISNFAKYVRYNMPQNASHTNPMLTDEEAWDVAAYVISMPRPHKETPEDWPDITKKPVDHPFGPYADTFSQVQHKFGTFKPIVEFVKSQLDASKK